MNSFLSAGLGLLGLIGLVFAVASAVGLGLVIAAVCAGRSSRPRLDGYRPYPG